jgi:hypothetical protein
MKRKVKKFRVGGETDYDQEDEGMFGGKIKYRVDPATGNKYVAGRANPFDRNPAEQRYYSVSDVKSKLGMGSKETSKPSETYIDKQLKRYADMPDVTDMTPEAPKGIASGFQSNQAKFERADNEVKLPKSFSVSKEKTTVTRNNKPNVVSQVKNNKPASSQSIPSDVVKAAEANKKRIEASNKPLETVSPESYLIGPGAGLKSLYGLAKNLVAKGVEKTAEKTTQKLAADNARQMLKDRAMAGTRAGQAAKEEADDLIRMGSDFMKKGGKVKAKPKMSYGGKVKKMASGGKSASARADGCAIRGKTRA